MTQNGSLTLKQQQFLLGLLSGQHVEEAAKTVKISSRTAYRWQRLPAFEKELSDAKAELFNKQLALLKDGVVLCLNTLRRNMGERTPPHVQVAAARCWLENAIAIHKTQALEESLAEVEHLLKEGGLRVPTTY